MGGAPIAVLPAGDTEKIFAYPSQSFWLPLLSKKIQHCSVGCGSASPILGF